MHRVDFSVKGSLLTHFMYSLPVPSLWIDVFQKVKAMGFNCVSFYVDWNLLEGKPGQYSAEGIFALEPFFDAAKEAGIYLLARPGPYINAEASGGGFPGWLQRVNGTLRTSDEAYLKSTDKYVIAHDTELEDVIETNFCLATSPMSPQQSPKAKSQKEVRSFCTSPKTSTAVPAADTKISQMEPTCSMSRTKRAMLVSLCL
jgi:hypothetical protein